MHAPCDGGLKTKNRGCWTAHELLMLPVIFHPDRARPALSSEAADLHCLGGRELGREQEQGAEASFALLKPEGSGR